MAGQPVPTWPLCLSAWSTSTSAIIASTMGTARGSTQGSWRPRPSSVVGLPSTSTVSCDRMMVATGLKAARMTMFSPIEMPPWMPPEWFVRVLTRPPWL